MIRAVIKGGAIHLLEPMPPGWREGEALIVEQAEGSAPVTHLDQWVHEVGQAASAIPPEEFELLSSALADADRVAKEAVRRDMGLDS